ncbi:hypothetical protein LAZ67_15001254 [Cordylochernes scorpioides]|uniref:DUF5641 domain-containing protein n=1 Tax=Cordylochernes scorpioides TaxID=51811 RepID=A0ABY6LB81_9ARAC|nr:hypothetical protein LAZ67_15001254 [Cordylochernes scorpioides]
MNGRPMTYVSDDPNDLERIFVPPGPEKQTHLQSKTPGWDVVLVGMDNKNFWPLAVIEEILFGRDGVNRLVKVKTAVGTFLRPIQKIYPLEISSTAASSRLLNDKEKTAKIQTRSGRTICKPNRLDDYLCFSVCLDKKQVGVCVEWWRSIIPDAAQTAQVSTVNTAAPACIKGAADINIRTRLGLLPTSRVFSSVLFRCIK